MNKTINYFKSQFLQLKDIKKFTKCCMLLAAMIAVSYINSYIGNVVKISFTFIFLAIIGMKFGPVICGVIAAIGDIVQFLIKPVGPYQPLLTMTALFTGILYGAFLFKDKITFPRLIISAIIKGIIINQLLNTYFITILYGVKFEAYFISRLPENLIMIPVEIIVLYYLLKRIKDLI